MASDRKKPQISSLAELEISLPDDVRRHLAEQYSSEHVERILQSMKTAPAVTTARVNIIRTTKHELIADLRQIFARRSKRHNEHVGDVKEGGTEKESQWVVKEDHIFDDVITIAAKEGRADDQSLPMSQLRRPPSLLQVQDAGRSDQTPKLFANWPQRAEKGWPLTHRVIVCDRLCGEAVLRGSDIFVKGVMVADHGITEGEEVAIYADLNTGGTSSVTRGLLLEKYAGHCVFLGLGIAMCSRAQIFQHNKGLAVEMCEGQANRAGPYLPPLNGVLIDKMRLQNLPSTLVGHVLDPHPGETLLDMCSAPGGKASHLASLTNNRALIVACDKSRRKMVAARTCFREIGASCIVPLALDSTDCVVLDGSSWQSVEDVISKANPSKKDGLLDIKAFYPESFDRILLDPPCSALGLRPKLSIVAQQLSDLLKHSEYQKLFVSKAVALLKPGGVMTYSTCTFNASENEEMVKYVLDQHPCMELVPIEYDFGLPGLCNAGLNEKQRLMVRRFDPSGEADTMGFFVAKLKKRE